MSLLEEAFEPPLPPPAAAGPPPAPVPTYTRRSVAAGTETELVVQTFDDRVLVIVTQNGKVGCLTQATLPPVHPLSAAPAAPPGVGDSDSDAHAHLVALPPPPAAIALTPLLGSPPDPTAHDVYVSQIATLVWWALQLAGAPRRPVVVGLALARLPTGVVEEGGERARFAGVMDLVAGWPGP